MKFYRIDCSAGKTPYSQRNNVLRPGVSCNVTSMVMMLDYAGHSFPTTGPYKQPEDNLLDFVLTNDAVQNYYQTVDPTNYFNYIKSGKDPEVSFPPNEVHQVLSFGTNAWMNKQVTSFSEAVTIPQLLFDTYKGRASVISGEFSNLHHVVVLVGFITTQELSSMTTTETVDMSKVSAVLIDDPYGDYRSGYKIHRGDNIEVPIQYFMDFVKPQKNTLTKRAHRLII